MGDSWRSFQRLRWTRIVKGYARVGPPVDFACSPDPTNERDVPNSVKRFDLLFGGFARQNCCASGLTFVRLDGLSDFNAAKIFENCVPLSMRGRDGPPVINQEPATSYRGHAVAIEGKPCCHHP